MKLPKYLTTVTPFSKFLALSLFIILPLVFFQEGFNLGSKIDKGNSEGISGKVCTQEAKLCPDGSYVGRTGPNCEFAKCPQSSPALTPTLPLKTITPTPTCIPRPKCLDNYPKCMIAETEDMCPPTIPPYYR